MRKFNIKTQIHSLYALTTAGYFQIAGASWVALLALRGFSLLEIGMLESIFHVVSSCFEIPSGVVADVFGRKRTMVLSRLVNLASSIFMIVSADFWTVAFAIGLNAISYNLESGTREALAYDSLKAVGQEEKYNRFASMEMMLYRVTNSVATLCAGLALGLGYKKAYAVDIFLPDSGWNCMQSEGSTDRNNACGKFAGKKKKKRRSVKECDKGKLVFFDHQSKSQIHYDLKRGDRRHIYAGIVLFAGKDSNGGSG